MKRRNGEGKNGMGERASGRTGAHSPMLLIAHAPVRFVARSGERLSEGGRGMWYFLPLIRVVTVEDRCPFFIA